MTGAGCPGRTWYGVALAVLILGGCVSGLFLWLRLAALETKLLRFVFPGTVELALEEPGTYTIFHEPRSLVDGRYYVSEDVSGMRVRVVSTESGAPLVLARPGMEETYSLRDHAGIAVLTFDLPAPERIRLSAAYDDGRSEPKVVLTVGHGFLGGLFGTVFATLAIGFGALGAAVAIGCVTYVKRRRAREQQQASAPTMA